MSNYTEPNFENIALITIDTQNDFTLSGAPLEIKGTLEVIPNMKKILKKFRDKNKPIIHVVRLYKTDGSNVDISRRSKIENGLRAVSPHTKGAELVEQIKPNEKNIDSDLLLEGKIQELSDNEYVMYKSRWGAFYQTPMEGFLKEKRIDTLVFCGCNFANCPRTSAYEASERDFKIIMISDATSGIYDQGIKEMENIGSIVLETNEIIEKI